MKVYHVYKSNPHVQYTGNMQPMVPSHVPLQIGYLCPAYLKEHLLNPPHEQLSHFQRSRIKRSQPLSHLHREELSL